MYFSILLVWFAAAAALVARGLIRQRRAVLVGGVLLLVAEVLFFALLGFWGEMLWFDAMGYANRFWTEVLVKAGLALFGGVVAVLFAGGLFWRPSRTPKAFAAATGVVAAIFGAFVAEASWDTVLLFWHRVSFGIKDPVFGFDVGFFLFTLPLLERLFLFFLVLLVLCGIAQLVLRMAVAGKSGLRSIDSLLQGIAGPGQDHRPWLYLVGTAALVFAGMNLLNAYHLMFSTRGVVTGPGWTDLHVRLPGYYGIAIVLLLLGAATLTFPLWSRWTKRSGFFSARRLRGPLAGLAVLWFLTLVVAPEMAQWLYVRPNEVSVEKPYIARNIKLTRLGFALDDVEQKEFPVSDKFNEATARRNQKVLDQVRLWDPRALEAVYRQFQEIRLYYEFIDVDIDRYTIDGNYRQVMVSPRELALDNLPAKSQTFVNRHFKYTHGYGLTMAPVNEFTLGGLPNLLVKDLPPQSTSADLKVTRPEIYYGELTDDYAVVNTREEEFDYPRGDHNVYVRYAGKGGVQLSNSWRRFVYGWKLGGTKFFLSSYPTDASRVMFDRDIRRRIGKLAPFLTLDSDPYIVLHKGRLFWIVDAYTTSRRFPYSESFSSDKPGSTLEGARYIRNSVKVVVDAYKGSTNFYVFDPEDPVIRVWRKVFPKLFQDRDAMPEELRKHIRYPEDLLLAQGLVYTRYHMTDPAVFYNQEDLWVRATENYYGKVQPVEPYYVMWEPPGTDEIEFILMQPFTPKNRQVLIGWIAGMCDGENYGRLLAYQFPKEKRVLGTQQVETKIDQDAVLSQRLSLWDQRGSRVVRGNVLAIPVGNTLLYVEPIYLQAESAAYPELRLVAVMHDDRLSYAENFNDALRGLYGEAAPPPVEGFPETRTTAKLIEQANMAYDAYMKAMGGENFDEAGRQLQSLRNALKALEQGNRPPATETDSR